MDMTVIFGAVVFIAVLFILYGHNKRLRRQLAARQSPPPHIPPLHTPPSYKTAEERQQERSQNQLGDVMRESVTFSTRRVMGRGEYNVFCAAMNVTGQGFPPGSYPVWIFPQVALGQIIRTSSALDWQADHAHQAINSKRCDLLLADRHGNPIAVVEYQGTGHDLGGTAERRDRIKRIALERACVDGPPVSRKDIGQRAEQCCGHVSGLFSSPAPGSVTGQGTGPDEVRVSNAIQGYAV